MWEWLTRYPSARIEDVGTPYVEDGGPENVATYDYIIVGGSLNAKQSLTVRRHRGVRIGEPAKRQSIGHRFANRTRECQ